LNVVTVQPQGTVQRGPHRGLVVDDQYARHVQSIREGRPTT
jgi:hypothetical protein